MARIRTIKPEFWLNEELASVSEPARLVAIGLLNLADDEGWFKAHSRLVESALFPFSEPSVSIHECLTQLSNIGYIVTYIGTDSKQYGQVVKFDEHQRVNRPSPSKIGPLIQFSEQSVINHGALTVGKEGKGKEQGKEGKGKEVVITKKVIKPESFKQFFTMYPPNKKGGTDATAWKKAKGLGFTDNDFILMTDDIEQRKALMPSWYATYAMGITKYLDERIWLTPITPEKQDASKFVHTMDALQGMQLSAPQQPNGLLNHD